MRPRRPPSRQWAFSRGPGGELAAPERAAPARRIAVAAALAENAAMQAMVVRLGTLGEPYEQGASGRYNKLAKGLTLAGAAVLGLAGRRRAGAVVGSSLLLAGEVCLRWSVFKAGFQSALDPRYTVEPQRARRRPAGAV